MRSLRYWMYRRPRLMRWTRCSGVLKATLESQPRREGPDPLDGVEVGCVGRQVVDGQPVPVLGQLSQVGGFVDVEVVPDEHDLAAELLVGGDQQVTVAAPGEALASVAAAVVPAWSVDQPGSVAGFVAGQRGDGYPSAGTAVGPHHRGPPAL